MIYVNLMLLRWNSSEGKCRSLSYGHNHGILGPYSSFSTAIPLLSTHSCLCMVGYALPFRSLVKLTLDSSLGSFNDSTNSRGMCVDHQAGHRM
jgi:hypothetical protein